MSNRFITLVLSLVAAAVFLIAGIALPVAAQNTKNPAMSKNKQTVQRYMDAFGKTDHATILSCLTDDVEWFIPGAFRITGKAAFDKEIENDSFVGSPTIKVTRMVEEGDVVIAEGSVRSARKDGGVLNLLFCDVFEMRDSKIKRLTSYLMEIKEGAPK
jgi:ketosteroid isomerase-like protein